LDLDLDLDRSLKNDENHDDDEHLVASIEDDPIVQQLPTRATFIPLRHLDLQTRILNRFQIAGKHSSLFQELCKRLQAIFHIEHLSALLQLEAIYSPLDPDEELIELTELSDEERDVLTDRFFDRLSGLLFSAHYKRLTREELERAIEIGSQWGVKLEVDFELYDRMEIFARGYRVINVKRRRWQNWFRSEVIELPEFQRLIMAFRLSASLDENLDKDGNPVPKPEHSELRKKFSELIKGDESGAIDSERVYLKTFKNIPETDLEILLPGTKIRFSLLDHSKILFPTAMALYKLSRFVVALTVLWFAAYSIDELIGSLILFGAIVGYFAKSVLSYFRTKTKYQFGLTKSLYLKNLGNNSGVIYRILNEAEEQELLETMLGYAILWQRECTARQDNEPLVGLTEDELDKAVEEFLLNETEIDIDFEIHDALGKMARLGLANVDRESRWRAVSIETASELLAQSWDRLFQLKNLKAISNESVDEDLFTS
jgi:hypothetical protein